MSALFRLAATGRDLQAPSFIALASTQVGSTSSTLVINKPTGTVQGDLMIAIMGNDNASCTWTGDTGWTEVADQGANPNLRVAYKVAGASEGSSYTFTCSQSQLLSGSILTYRGAAYTTIGAITTASSPTAVAGVTTLNDNSRIIGAVYRITGSVTITAPASMTTRVTNSDTTAPSYVIADEVIAKASATGTRTFTGSNTMSGVLLAIQPA